MMGEDVQRRVVSFVEAILAVAVGLAAAFFTTGPALFADGEFRERVWSLGIAAVAFVLLGMVVGVSSPTRWRMLALCLWAGTVPVAAFFALDQLGNVPFGLLALGFVVGDLAAALFGSWTGMRLRGMRTTA